MRWKKRSVSACGLAMLLALSPAAGIAGPKSQSATTVSVKAPNIRIDNFGRVNAQYYRGAQPTARDFRDLAAFGVRMVIDLQADGNPGEARLVEAAGMRFQRIPMTTRTAPASEQLARFLQLVNDPANQPVYVHCAGGRHRTGVMTAVYRMTHDGWSADRAFSEMKQYKFGADFLHPEFKRFVYAYRIAEPDRTAPVATVASVTATN